MSIERQLGIFFKAEARSSGARLFAQEKVSISSGSDTGIHAHVRGMPPLKVRLSSDGVASSVLTAECGCAPSQKGQLCKHLWAVLLATEQDHPDFLASKNSIEIRSKAPVAPVPGGRPSRSEHEALAKARAAEYRREQYQKQKDQVKAKKAEKRGSKTQASEPSFSPEIEAALVYFAQNGFEMSSGPDEAMVREAKRKLSRVFHPDKGGQNDEMVELNRYAELLLRFLGEYDR